MEGIFNNSSNKRRYGQVTEEIRNTLLSELREDTTIDEQSRKEFLAQANSLSAGRTVLTDIRNEFTRAKEGVLPKYKARQAAQQMFNLLQDQPGQRQTKGPDVSLLMSNNIMGAQNNTKLGTEFSSKSRLTALENLSRGGVK